MKCGSPSSISELWTSSPICVRLQQGSEAGSSDSVSQKSCHPQLLLYKARVLGQMCVKGMDKKCARHVIAMATSCTSMYMDYLLEKAQMIKPAAYDYNNAKIDDLASGKHED